MWMSMYGSLHRGSVVTNQHPNRILLVRNHSEGTSTKNYSKRFFFQVNLLCYKTNRSGALLLILFLKSLPRITQRKGAHALNKYLKPPIVQKHEFFLRQWKRKLFPSWFHRRFFDVFQSNASMIRRTKLSKKGVYGTATCFCFWTPTMNVATSSAGSQSEWDVDWYKRASLL